MGFKETAWKLAAKGINKIAGNAAETFEYHQFTGTIRPDANNPSKVEPQYTVYPRPGDPPLKGILNPSTKGESAGELQLQQRKRFRNSIKLKIARQGLPFTPTTTDNPETRSKIVLNDGLVFSVIEVAPGDATGATFDLIGSRQTM